MSVEIRLTPDMAFPLSRKGPSAMGGPSPYEAASRFSQELATWSPPSLSPDQEINYDKGLLDSRVRDMVRNDSYASAGVGLHRDGIVGSQFRLNSTPDWRALGSDESWAEEFQTWAETQFTLWAESPNNWPDASRLNTFTGLVRMVVGLGALCGESLSTVEWLRSDNERRPANTAIQMVHVDRLSNPNDESDSASIRRGIERDRYGAPVAAHIRTTHPSEWYSDNPISHWTRVPWRKPWGRQQVIHIYEQTLPDQSRGISSMVSALKTMKMASHFRSTVLQNAVVNATYAAAIESELPPEIVAESLGAGTGDNGIERYLESLSQYMGGSRNFQIDGVRVPHLFPGTKLSLKPMGTPGGVGTVFEQSLLRNTAAALGISYEQLSRDYTQTNYSSARAAMVETWKFMQARKKLFADRFASTVFSLWLEEQINAGNAPLPLGKTAASFYQGLNAEAYSSCDWIGAARGQIDELKETQAAVMRKQNNLSTDEEEIGRTGKDWRQVYAQRAREKALREKLGLDDGPQPGANANAAQQDAQEEKAAA